MKYQQSSEPKNFSGINIIFIILIILILIGFVGNKDYEDQMNDQSNYCSMVDLYKESNGKHGWPDYEGIYKTSCKN